MYFQMAYLAYLMALLDVQVYLLQSYKLYQLIAVVFKDGSNHFWVALIADRNPVFETILSFSWLRKLILMLNLDLAGKPHGHIVGTIRVSF